jgi:protein-arginine kinase activator protein McsA
MKVNDTLLLQRLARYKLELAEFVKKEEYEKAAKWRDRIKNLEQRLHDTGRISKIGKEKLHV